MTLSVIEGHSPIASLFKCNISYLWRGPSASAELLVNTRCKSEGCRQSSTNCYYIQNTGTI